MTGVSSCGSEMEELFREDGWQGGVWHKPDLWWRGREGRVSGSLPDAELSTGGSTEIWECQGAKFDQERTLQKQPALEFPMQLVTGKKKL